MRRALPFLFAAVVTFVGCGGGGGGGTSGSAPPPNAPVPQVQQLDAPSAAAADAQSDAADTTASLTLADPVDPGLAGLSVARAPQDTGTTPPSTRPSTTPSPIISGSPEPRPSTTISGSPEPRPTPNPCVVVSPIPVVDANKNGIPDNETWTYKNCTRPGPGGSTDTLSGIVNLSDTSSGTTTSWVRTVNNLTDAQSGGTGPTFTDVLNGSASHAIANGTVETIARDFTNQVSGASGSTTGSMTASTKETIVFTAAAGATIPIFGNPPSGTLTVTGNRQVTQTLNGTTTTYGYAVATPTALTYDATCKTPPRIVAGQLQMTYTSAAGTKTVTLTFTGCGIPPTVTKT